MSSPPRPRGGILAGMFRIARGRADGVACFGGSPQSYLASLAPLVAFPLVGAAMGLSSEGPRRALTDLAMTLCAILTPAVLSYELARFWKREESWFRYATAFNWCEWLLPIVAVLAMMPLSIAIGAGMRQTVAAGLFIICLGLYGLWLHWFLARKALGLSGGKAVLLVLIVNAGTAAAVILPGLFGADRA
ncbi:MAG: hypothetical protein U1E70_10825 [Acetobacteraceae bacterium]|nr:hypothetical protein [Pseudomonadota bacterium]